MKILKTKLKWYSASISSNASRVLPSPQRAAIGFLEQVHGQRALLPFTETVSCVKKAPIKLKMLFIEKGHRKEVCQMC